ncbi:hypothetical protein A3C05_03475 [Candidatus Giovannonibacteria bacterium RIFCSPHIGHO2_02_FULL_45_40]|uniref:PepSY domain-containing protein n=1 Tax=Candidatus Giovannonibacteria bacterium RIFCSPHIGHO2_02_FULL_45_40 TaxID=1798337 RepID=A0A1F5WAC7_9BACT|nr:MAG: hypothetical protein A2W40_01405 [Candidatus Giovannonibacteria bacterium RIFCSPHIGHO2_01_45_12]OGF60532.1 MAG: hypothetical protein A2656_01200 [Candidatus Giovannonibacteria bacterium RIFCSPHIGHO2_01_FULL_44_100]OGF72599.1 MAG: hypothetical protein A3C05_03475 [Candidatus Giovannonibacteria bacterium RIFCSPHIGHO2_02_FULL_45_40]
MSTEDSAKIVRAAHVYLVNVLIASGTPTDKVSGFRVEELSLDEGTKNYKVTLSYEMAGDFQFDKKREYKDFEITPDGKVLSMKIRKP